MELAVDDGIDETLSEALPECQRRFVGLCLLYGFNIYPFFGKDG